MRSTKTSSPARGGWRVPQLPFLQKEAPLTSNDVRLGPETMGPGDRRKGELIGDLRSGGHQQIESES